MEKSEPPEIAVVSSSDGRIESNNNNATSGAPVKKEIWIISDQKAVAAPGTSVGDPRLEGAGNVPSMPSCIGPDGLLGRGVKFMEAKMEKLGQLNREDSRANMKVPQMPDLARCFFAETLGTFLLVVFGDGAIAQIVTGGDPKGNFLNIAFGYGFALMIGILVSGGVSGGHLNPAVTVTMAVLKKLEWKKVPVYILGQHLGAFLASVVLYGIYYNEMTRINPDFSVPGTAGIFASYPANENISIVTLVFDQLFGTALLLIIILAVTDENNMKIHQSLVPLFIGLGLTAIHISFAQNAGCAINPARDLAPRLFTLMGGWGKQTFNYQNYFFWIPTFIPYIGGIVGGAIYSSMVSSHHRRDEVTDLRNIEMS